VSRRHPEEPLLRVRRGIHHHVVLLRRPASRLLASLVVAVLAGAACRRAPAPPPVDALQQAFRDHALTARESRGRQLFAERCATCHGPTGRGDGQNAYNLSPPPPDFAESLSALPPAQRRRVIVEGTAVLGRSPLCPPRGTVLDDDQIDALLAYLEVMARPAPEEEAPGPGRRRWRRPR
jgi:mono/diheme cytochrome c family protein